MSNKHRGEVALPIGDATYTLRYSLDTLADIEDEFGASVADVLSQLQDTSKPQLRKLQKILLAGLREFHPEMTLKDAGRLGVPVDIVQHIIVAINGGEDPADGEAKAAETRPGDQKQS